MSVFHSNPQGNSSRLLGFPRSPPPLESLSFLLYPRPLLFLWSLHWTPRLFESIHIVGLLGFPEFDTRDQRLKTPHCYIIWYTLFYYYLQKLLYCIFYFLMWTDCVIWIMFTLETHFEGAKDFSEERKEYNEVYRLRQNTGSKIVWTFMSP